MTPIKFTVPGAPATITAQQKGIRVGAFKRAIFYTKAEVKAEHRRIRMVAWHKRPAAPLEGPLYVLIEAVFPLTDALATKYAADLSSLWFRLPKATRPDADNTGKLILDVLTDCGFWKDDAQVADLRIRKFYGVTPCLNIEIQPFDVG